MDKNHMDSLVADPEQEENSPAWKRAVLRILEKRGKLARTGRFKTDTDGLLCPVYVLVGDESEFEHDYRYAEIEHAFNSLERKGLIRKTGNYRLGEDGRRYPGYVVVEESGSH